MTTAAQKDWKKDFGLDGRRPPSLFTSKDQMTPTTPQAHLLRRAFDVLKVDGVLCVDHSPLAYFKLVKRITPEAVAELHRQFWNHSGASLLVLVTDDHVHIYSGMTRPEPATTTADLPSLVDSLDRVPEGLRQFVVAVESGSSSTGTSPRSIQSNGLTGTCSITFNRPGRNSTPRPKKKYPPRFSTRCFAAWCSPVTSSTAKSSVRNTWPTWGFTMRPTFGICSATRHHRKPGMGFTGCSRN